LACSSKITRVYAMPFFGRRVSRCMQSTPNLQAPAAFPSVPISLHSTPKRL
jgi:hypothetical protein